MRNSGTQSAFTLIELVVVITILGILAAFAIPRFVSLESQARVAARNALAGNLRSGAALAHALWIANGKASPVVMEGREIVIVNGYPDAATIDNTLVDSSDYTYSHSGMNGTFTSVSRSACTVTYAEAPSADGAPTIAVGASEC